MQRLRELRGGGEPVGRRAGERLEHRLLHHRGHGIADLVQGARRIGEPPHQHDLRRRAGERGLAGDGLVEDASQAVHVGAAIHIPLARRLLRTHVRRRADAHPGLGELRVVAAERARDAEVGDQRRTVRRQQDVLRLHVAVHHAMAVRVVERAGGLGPDPHRVLERELALPVQSASERLALDERHREPEMAAGLTGVEHRQDVGMLQPRGEADLALEPLGAERDGQLRMEHLERDRAVVLEVVREKDGGHAPASDLALEGITTSQPSLEVRPQVCHVGQEPANCVRSCSIRTHGAHCQRRSASDAPPGGSSGSSE